MRVTAEEGRARGHVWNAGAAGDHADLSEPGDGREPPNRHHRPGCYAAAGTLPDAHQSCSATAGDWRKAGKLRRTQQQLHISAAGAPDKRRQPVWACGQTDEAKSTRRRPLIRSPQWRDHQDHQPPYIYRHLDQRQLTACGRSGIFTEAHREGHSAPVAVVILLLAEYSHTAPEPEPLNSPETGWLRKSRPWQADPRIPDRSQDQAGAGAGWLQGQNPGGG